MARVLVFLFALIAASPAMAQQQQPTCDERAKSLEQQLESAKRAIAEQMRVNAHLRTEVLGLQRTLEARQKAN